MLRLAYKTLVRKEAPTVGAVREEKASWTNRRARLVLPTPVSPKRTILASMEAILAFPTSDFSLRSVAAIFAGGGRLLEPRAEIRIQISQIL